MTNIASLEALLNQEGLISGLPYDNPDRQKSVYFQHVRDYAASLGIELTEEGAGFIGYLKSDLRFLNPFGKNEFLFAHNRLSPLRRLELFLDVAVCSPFIILKYLSDGGRFEFIPGKETAKIVIPAYEGITALLDPSYKGVENGSDIHEYNHAHHWLMRVDLGRKGVLRIDGFHDVDFELVAGLLFINVPDYKGLVKFEKKVLRAMIAEEKRRFPE